MGPPATVRYWLGACAHGEVFYEWNNLAEAGNLLSKGLERAKLGGDIRTLLAGSVLTARLKLTEGSAALASEYLGRACSLIEDAMFPEWASRVERCQLEIWLAQDRLDAAVAWVDAVSGDPQRALRLETELTELAIARVLTAKGDVPSIKQALVRLDKLIEAAEGEGRLALLIEGLALQALAYQKLKDGTNAMSVLARALRWAEPEGYVRLFADLGFSMAQLLQEAHIRGVSAGYVEKLLEAFGTSSGLVSTTGLIVLPAPLTPREQEILKFVAAGLTNREIAEKLIISPETVKKHTRAIYSKLSVGNRTEAATRARKLDLLD